MTVKQINISDYNYELPDERIAKFPLEKRDSSKLLTYVSGNVSTNVFRSLPDILPANSCLVFNNTRVIQARLEFFKSTGSRIEIFCLEQFIETNKKKYALISTYLFLLLYNQANQSNPCRCSRPSQELRRRAQPRRNSDC